MIATLAFRTRPRQPSVITCDTTTRYLSMTPIIKEPGKRPGRVQLSEKVQKQQFLGEENSSLPRPPARGAWALFFFFLQRGCSMHPGMELSRAPPRGTRTALTEGRIIRRKYSFSAGNGPEPFWHRGFSPLTIGVWALGLLMPVKPPPLVPTENIPLSRIAVANEPNISPVFATPPEQRFSTETRHIHKTADLWSISPSQPRFIVRQLCTPFKC